jgi:hypothetical protein
VSRLRWNIEQEKEKKMAKEKEKLKEKLKLTARFPDPIGNCGSGAMSWTFGKMGPL